MMKSSFKNDLRQPPINERLVAELIARAFKEDIGDGDVTTNAIIGKNVQSRASWLAKETGTVAGLDVARLVFQTLDPDLTWNPVVQDGERVQAGTTIVTIEGSCRAVLTAERTALNFAQRMSGIASSTDQLVQAISGTRAKILDTRKTIPGLRALDKYAVVAGGGTNHRMGLFDLAMIKDNHIVAAGGIAEAIELVKKGSPKIKIEVETTNHDEVKEALGAGADIIMLDNMSADLMKKAVSDIGDDAKTEASGNITIENIKQIADTGVDYISAGALTHSVKAFDISQNIDKIL